MTEKEGQQRTNNAPSISKLHGIKKKSERARILLETQIMITYILQTKLLLVGDGVGRVVGVGVDGGG